MGTFPQETQHVLLEVGIVEAAQNVRDTESLRYALGLAILLLIEGDIVVAADLNDRVQKFGTLMLASLLLLDDDSSLDVQVVVFVL